VKASSSITAYKLEVDFANDVTALKDAYVEYNGLPMA
jgi:hypothetical protein